MAHSILHSHNLATTCPKKTFMCRFFLQITLWGMCVEVYIHDSLMTKRALIQLPVKVLPTRLYSYWMIPPVRLPDATRLTLPSWQIRQDFDGISFGKEFINMLNHNTFPATWWSHSEFNIVSFKMYNLYQPEVMLMNRSFLRDGSIRSECSLPWDLLQSSHCALWAQYIPKRTRNIDLDTYHQKIGHRSLLYT